MEKKKKERERKGKCKDGRVTSFGQIEDGPIAIEGGSAILSIFIFIFLSLEWSPSHPNGKNKIKKI
jgi:hypothetical protein